MAPSVPAHEDEPAAEPSPENEAAAVPTTVTAEPATVEPESESESERYLFDPHKKVIQSNNEKQLGSGDPY